MKNRLRKSLAALLTLSMLVGLFPMTAMAAPATDTTDNGVHLTKTLVTRNDAPYIKLEAWTEGDVTSTTAASPADVILVLDQSGSMSGSVSNIKKTAQSFVKDLAQLNTENNDKYRVAIVGFASDPTNTEILTVNGTEWANDYVPVSGPLDTNKDYYVQLGSGYERIHYYDYEFFGQPVGWYVGSSWEFRGEYIDPAKYTVYDVQRVEKESDTPGKQYDELTDADYQGAFDNCTKDTVANNGSLTKAIEALSANGATRADLGMGIAQKIFEAQSDDSSDNRQKVVVFLTDGEPTTSNRFDNNVANGAISAAKAMKDEGAKVYSLYYGSPNDACENFMQAVSSNYPNATTLNQMGVKIANTYYAAGSNWNGIDDLLQSIIISISAPKLDEQGVVSDTLSKYVRLANTNTGDPNYTKQIETYMVAKTKEGWSGTEQRFNNARVTIANKTVNVSGFAFDDRCVTTSPKDGTGGSDYGAKLVIYIPIAIDAGADTFGGYLPTNDAASIKDADAQTMATAEGVYRDRAMSYTLGDFARTINAENQDSFTVTLGDSDSTSANAATVNMDTVLSKLITTLPNGANNEGVTMRYELWDTGEDLSDNQGTLMASYDVDQGADASALSDWSNWNWEDNANTGKSYTMDLTNNLARKTFMLRVVLTSTNPKQQLTHNAYGIFELNVQNTDTFVVSARIDQTDPLNRVTVPDSDAFTEGGEGRLTQYTTGEIVDENTDATAVTFIPATHHEITRVTKQIGNGDTEDIYTKAQGILDNNLVDHNDGSMTYTAKNVTANVAINTYTAPITHTLTTVHDANSGIMEGCSYNESEDTLAVTFGAMPGYAIDALTVNATTYSAADLLAKNEGDLEALGISLTTQTDAKGEDVIVGGDVDVSQLTDNKVEVSADTPITYKLTYRYYTETLSDDGITYEVLNKGDFTTKTVYVTYGQTIDGTDKTPGADYTIDGVVYKMSDWYETARTSGSDVVGFDNPVQVGAKTMPAGDYVIHAYLEKYDNTTYQVNVEKKIQGDAYSGNETFTVEAYLGTNQVGTTTLNAGEKKSLTVTLTEAQKRSFEAGENIVVREKVPTNPVNWIYDRTVYLMHYSAQGITLTQNQKTVESAVFTNTYDDPSAPLDTFTVTYTDGVDGEEVFADKVIRDLKAGDQTPAFGDHPTRSGYTFTGWEPSVAETVTQSVTYTAQWEKNGGTGPVVTKVKLHYESNGGTAYADETYKKGTVVTLDKHPIREGHTFTGWYADEACTDKIEKITMNGNKTVYAGWKQTDVPSVFTDDHISYVVGFVDGTVKPLADISRAEVASIFYRLLTDEERAKYDTNENSFSDVPKDAWYNTPASTMAAMGIVAGYPDGDFHGSDSITRAEFAAIAARFDDDTDNTGAAFNDISGHWAEKDIVNAANKGWIMGYTDGSFRPNQTITRAEAMSLINRVLQRNPESADDLLAGMIEWPDNMNTAKWYYLPVQEATNSHDYDRKDNGTEKWTALKNK